MLEGWAQGKVLIGFAGLGQQGPLAQGDLHRMVDATLADTYAKNMEPPLTETRLAQALIKTNELGSRRKKQPPS